MGEIANSEEGNSIPHMQLAARSVGSDLELAESRQVKSGDIAIANGDIPEASQNCASVDLAIQSSALSVSLRSRASLHPETIALNAQVRILTDQLAQVAAKLDEANYKIGFLEAQILAQREKLQELCKPVGESRPIKCGAFDWLKNRLSFKRGPENRT